MRICGLYRANYGHFWKPTMEHDQLGQVRNENNWAKSTCRAKADSDATDNHRRFIPVETVLTNSESKFPFLVPYGSRPAGEGRVYK